ncbi:MAG: hypothetical protein ACK5V0_12875, partial [Alphaproteobacteria bacterium]
IACRTIRRCAAAHDNGSVPAASCAPPCSKHSLAIMTDALRISGADGAVPIPTFKKYFWDVNIFCSSSSVLPLQDLHLENARPYFCG